MLPDYDNDIVLRERLKSKDPDAFSFLYDNNRQWMFVLALSIVKEKLDAQDLVQELFIDFWHHDRSENINTSLKGYLSNAVKNRSYNFMRNKDVRKRRESNLPVSREFVMPVFTLENAELKRDLDNAIEKLSPSTSRVFQLAYIEEKSYQQIAADLAISRNTVMNHMVRALRILRGKLKKWETV